MQTLKNDILTIEVSEHGAELQSIRKGDVEYLWQGDPAYWGRRSPVLFPIVGSVWEKRFRIDGKEYELGQHGFARDMDFELTYQSEDELRYTLSSSEETLSKYPFEFTLEIIYSLEGNRLHVMWYVINGNNKVMHFQIGAHPAFNYPDYSPETLERGFLVFDKKDGLECIRIKEKGCVDTQHTYPLEIPSDGRLPITRDTFDSIDTLMLEGSQIGKTELLRADGTPWLSLTFDAPVVGIWSPPGKVAPFICLEPWYGRCDAAGYTGEFKDKDWMNSIDPGHKFIGSYVIEIA